MLSVSDRRTLASARANFTRAIESGVQPRRSDVYVRRNGKTTYKSGMTDLKLLALLKADKRLRADARSVSGENSGKQRNRWSLRASRTEKLYRQVPQFVNLRIWKHSHGGDSFENELERKSYKQRRIITLHKNTGKGQGTAFKEEMQPGDFVYICHGNSVQLLGQITSDILKVSAKWPERRYRVIGESRTSNSRYDGRQRKWTPNYNSTCALVPTDAMPEFERSILYPFFGLRLGELQGQAPEEPITSQEDDALSSLPKQKYEEAVQRLVRHKRLEMKLVRNRRLVQAAKRHFKARHGKLFCEVCKFDFQIEYGIRGLDFIEAHHQKPIAKIRAGTRLRIADLSMVCANCHRMLHRPLTTIRQLKKEKRLERRRYRQKLA
jgi:hypothetical protein